MGSLFLYPSNTKDFTNQGKGKLSLIRDDKVDEERNGEFFLEFTIFHSDPLFKDIVVGSYIKCDASPQLKEQRFEVAKINKTSDKRSTVYAEHCSYITKHLTVKGPQKIENKSADEALKIWKNNIVDDNPITTYSNIATISSSKIEEEEIENARQALGGIRGSILQTYNGEYLFDNYKISLLGRRGVKRNVVISYGKNLLSLQQDEEIESVHTSIQPFAKIQVGDKDKLIKIPEHYIDGPTVSKFTHRRILKVDFSEKMGEKDGVDKLRTLAKKYIKDNNIGYPKVSLTVEHFDLSKTVEYKDIKGSEELNLCDEVTVRFEELDIDVTAKIIKVSYSPIMERYLSLDIGESKFTLSDHIGNIENEVAEISKNYLNTEVAKQIIDYQTDLITGNKGGNMIIRYSSEGKPNEVLFMDTDNVNTAREVLRINRKGIGFSTKGSEGPFDTAWTLNGVFNASYITTGILKGPSSWWNLMTGEIFFDKGKIKGSNSSWDLDTGNINFNKGKITGSNSSWNLDTGVMNFSKGRIKGNGKNTIEFNVDDGQLTSFEEYSEDGQKFNTPIRVRLSGGKIIIKNNETNGYVGKVGGVRYVEAPYDPSGMAIGGGYNYQVSIGKMTSAGNAPVYPAIQIPKESKPDLNKDNWNMIFHAKVKDASGTLSTASHTRANVSKSGVFKTYANYSNDKVITETGTIFCGDGETTVFLSEKFRSVATIKNVQVTPNSMCMFSVKKNSDSFLIKCSQNNVYFDWSVTGDLIEGGVEMVNKPSARRRTRRSLPDRDPSDLTKEDIEHLYAPPKEVQMEDE